MTGWKDAPPPYVRIGAAGWLRALARGLPLALLVYGGLVVLLLARLVERPLCGANRPVTPYVTQWVCRAAFAVMGLPFSVRGAPMQGRGAVVANHASWLDIFALNAAQRVYFVAKAEVEGWAGIGWLARATGTLFIARKGTEAKLHQSLFESRLRAGHRLLFFPEGTSTDAIRVLPFKSTLFQAFYTHGMEHVMQIQPATVVYHGPPGQDPRYYGWWGEMDFARSLLHVLATRQHGRVEVIFHPPVAVDAFAGRKELSAHCEATIRAAHPFATTDLPPA